MNADVIAMFIPIMALAIPVVAILMNGLQKVSRMRLEEAQLRSHGGESSEEVQALRSELETVRRELSELNERVDFTERLLARGRSPDAVEKEVRPHP